MAIVRMMLKYTDKPSEEQLEELRKGKIGRTIVFDEDSPEMTDEMLAKFRRVHRKETLDQSAVSS
ncbi:MAG: hypothetical protein IJU50_11495 [Lachnospiraceae bacterium]|nr:hypothetical protein [Lachnospiraceae bacterium]